jgi:hypothetical protein
MTRKTFAEVYKARIGSLFPQQRPFEVSATETSAPVQSGKHVSAARLKGGWIKSLFVSFEIIAPIIKASQLLVGIWARALEKTTHL